MPQHVNLSSYNNVEDINNFTEESFKEYCDNKLDGCKKHIEFIKKLTIKNNNLNVFEIGSGRRKNFYLD
ncbi:MAG: hypothetical protein U9N02_02850 [Campylobacterota bacterium]|nr:hypothetical protein [Campylobacterota bacterium]